MTAMWRHRLWNSNEKKDRKTEMVCSFSGAVGIFFRLHSASFALYSKLQIELEPDLEYVPLCWCRAKKTMCLISTSNYIALRWLVSIRRTNQMETDVCMHQKCLVNVGLTRIGYIYCMAGISLRLPRSNGRNTRIERVMEFRSKKR